MPNLNYRLLLLLPALLVASPAAISRTVETAVIARVSGDQPSVVVFLPPSMRESGNKNNAAAREQVKAALADVKECLGPDDVSYRLVFADRLDVHSHGHDEIFEVRYFAPLVGALLLRADRNPRILYAGGGPQALAQMLRLAAGEYFGRTCKDGSLQ